MPYPTPAYDLAYAEMDLRCRERCPHTEESLKLRAPRQGQGPAGQLGSAGVSRLTLAVCAAPIQPDYNDPEPCTDPQEVVFTCVEWATLLQRVQPPVSCPT